MLLRGGAGFVAPLAVEDLPVLASAVAACDYLGAALPAAAAVCVRLLPGAEAGAVEEARAAEAKAVTAARAAHEASAAAEKARAAAEKARAAAPTEKARASFHTVMEQTSFAARPRSSLCGLPHVGHLGA